MLTSLALIFLTGLLLASLFEKLKLPRIIGMLLAGILLGPYVLNLLDDSVLSISSDLRQMALIIILIKAGLSLNLSDLKKVGRPAILMSFVPATFEIIGYVLLAPTLLGISKSRQQSWDLCSLPFPLPSSSRVWSSSWKRIMAPKKVYPSSLWPGHPVMIFLSLYCFLHFRAWLRAVLQTS